MSERKALTTLHNGCSARRTVRRTYGKKGKASTAGSQNFLIMVDELQTQMNRFGISDIKEDCEKEDQNLSESAKELEETKAEAHVDKVSGSPAKSLKKQSPRLSLSKEVPQTEFASLSEDEQIILKFTEQYSAHGVTSFRAYGKKIGKEYDVKKIGEGVYSSVFALTRKDNAESNNSTETDPIPRITVIKMMPISLPSEGESTGMTEPTLVANELQTLDAMSPVHGFVRYRGVTVVLGSWPATFLDAFRKYKNTNKAAAINEDPETAFGPNQYYALIEMEDAGREVNHISRPNDFQIYDIFWSTCIHLANAENSVHFEHRDMHISNICVKSSSSDNDRIDVEQSIVEDMLVFPDTILGMSNITTTIIDYTYSRVTPPATTNNNDPSAVTFRPAMLSEHEYDDFKRDFTKKRSRESRDDYATRLQDLTYSKVMKCVNFEYYRDLDPRNTTPAPKWETHVPKTNVCWLGYLITCLLARAGKISRTKYVERSNSVAKQVQDSIRVKMEALRECLMDADIDKIPESATDIVRIGVEKGWLKKEEIEMFKMKLEEDS